jgi:polyketide cyclase/dehydrase/lipid transport protein
VKRFFVLLVIAGACAGVFYVIGLVLPRTQSTASRTNFQANPQEVFKVVSDVANWDDWQPNIARVEERPEKNGHPVWHVTDREGKSWDMDITVVQEPLAFAASYELDGTKRSLRFDIKWLGQGSIVRITSLRDCRSPWVRARRGFTNEHAELLQVLLGLGRKLGEETKPEEV